TLKSAFDIAKEAGLEFVYLGNCRGEGENTFCPGCGKLLIEREGYFIRQNNISSSGCPKCSTPIPGIY
ncbi:MAG: hypothetical protein ABH825_01345, partial [Candidatus Omnitrophota bacterium]